MNLTKPLFFVLLVLDAALLALAAAPAAGLPSPLASVGEPERLRNQLHPDRIKVLPGATNAVAPATTRPSEPTPPAPEQTAAPAPAAACLAYSALNADQVATVSARAKEAGQAVSLREISAPGAPSSWWVNIPPQGGKEAADRRADTLRRNGIQDFFIVQDAGANQYAVSLGLFRSEAAAKRQLESIQSKGVTTARISTRDGHETTRVELHGPADLIDGIGRDLGSKLKGVETATCQVS
ncbi:MAG: SPOR domain-containing protein [Rhodocyclaceae bacterium]